jgi:transposase-like protein
MGRGGRTPIKGVHARTNRHERPQFTFEFRFAVVEHYLENGSIRSTVERFFPNVNR